MSDEAAKASPPDPDQSPTGYARCAHCKALVSLDAAVRTDEQTTDHGSHWGWAHAECVSNAAQSEASPPDPSEVASSDADASLRAESWVAEDGLEEAIARLLAGVPDDLPNLKPTVRTYEQVRARDRVAVVLSNAALRIASKEYRAALYQAIHLGLLQMAVDPKNPPFTEPLDDPVSQPEPVGEGNNPDVPDVVSGSSQVTEGGAGA